jgi:protein-S-isoprenylcysteine O-methyltransferase Ste14
LTKSLHQFRERVDEAQGVDRADTSTTIQEVEMELFPTLRIGWLNGWLPMGILYLIFGILLLVFPKEVVSRLYDRSNWSREQRVIVLIGKLLVLVWFPLIIFAPLKIGSPVFVIGMVLFALGLVGFVVALFNFRNTPLDRPVTKGLYRVSRNPQQFMLLVAGLGISIAIGSWLTLLMLLLGLVFTHRKLLAEEASCLRQYGDAYRAYMERVPRYFLFF